MITNKKIIRKCLLVIVIFIISCFNIYFKGSYSKRASNSSSSSSSSSILTSTIKEELDSNNHHHSHQNFQSRNLQQLNEDNEQQQNDNDSFDESNNDTTTTTGNSTHLKKYKFGAEKPILQLIDSKKNKSCIDPAYMEFPPDLFSAKARSRGAILIHVAVVCYMFYCLAVVCDHYFLPSLEECALRLNLSQDVAGATFMAAGSSAPELFTAILGVFIAKGDVGTGTIVGSAVFNILFVIGFCSLYTESTQLNWWPVARDSSYYTFTVLLLILCIYDEEVTCFESFILLVFYGVYIVIMKYNLQLKELVFQQWQQRFPTKPVVIDELNNNFKTQSVNYQSFQENDFDEFGAPRTQFGQQPPLPSTVRNPFVVRQPEVTLFEAANQIIIKYKRLFRPLTRFRAGAHLVILRSRKAKKNLGGIPRSLSMESRKMSKIGPDGQFWLNVPDPNIDGYYECAKWAVIAPLYASLYYTIPDCKSKKNMFLATFFVSILWTASFSYIMVWMVTMIGFTLGIPDSIMGITFLAAGTSVPDAYASMHVAKMGRADMAVSNSIGSNVFDILVGLALPWFVETAIVEPGTVSNINSGGLVYAVILLFLSLMMLIYLFHRNNWTLSPNLGYSLLITYVVFLIISSAIEFNLFGVVNPPICGE